MSRTDKTDPYWVKVERYGIEDHDHRNGVCDYEISSKEKGSPRWKYQSCEDTMSGGWAYSSRYDERASVVKWWSNYFERSNRRETKRLLRKGDYDSIAPYKNRHSAGWHCD